MFQQRLIDALQVTLGFDIEQLVQDSQLREVKENSLLYVLQTYTTQYQAESGNARFTVDVLLVGSNIELGLLECTFLEKWRDKSDMQLTLVSSNAYRESASKLINEMRLTGTLTQQFNQPREPLEIVEVNINE